jgi:hypothetical protein
LGVPFSVTGNESDHGYDDHLSWVNSMAKAKAASQKDLFGHVIKRRTSRLESLLTRIDRESYQIRLERLKYIESIKPKGLGMAGSIEAIFIFQEAGWAYLNGAFISTILLSQAFVERRLQDYMSSKGLEAEGKKGAQTIINYCRKHHLVNEFLLKKFDRLRQVRNPLVHLKAIDHPFTLGRRSFGEQKQPTDILERDAKEALSLMYTILTTRL